MNSVTKHNIDYFNSHVDQFKKDYFDKAEEYLTKKYFKGKRILVLGCGAGRTLLPLYKMGFEVTGIDISHKMIKASRKKVKNLPIKVFEMNACNLDFPDNSFDNVFFPFHGIDYIFPDIMEAILEARRVTKPNGVFIFNSHNRFNLKALPRFFKGPYTNYQGLITYRTTLVDFWKLKKLFLKVKMIPASSILTKWNKATWKEKIYKILPFFDSSTYFVCMGK